MNNKNYSKSANNRESDAQNRVNNDTKNRTEQKNKQNEVKSDVMNLFRALRRQLARARHSRGTHSCSLSAASSRT